MAVRFYLKDKHTDGKSLIVGAYSVDAKTFTFSTGLKVKPRYFSEVTRRVKGAVLEREAINMRLDRFAREVPVLYEELLDKYSYVTRDSFKEGIKEIRGKKRRGVDVVDFIEQQIEERRVSGNYAAGSIHVYEALLKDLVAFRAQKGQFGWQDIGYNWFVSFRDFVYSAIASRGSAGADNTVRKRLETLKMFLRESVRQRVNTCRDFETVDMKALKLSKTPSDTIYLTTDEIEQFYNAELSEYPALARARDCFITACYVGARHGDWSKIKDDNIRTVDGIELLTYYANKTGVFCAVPVLPIVREVLNKYGGKLPVISNQKTNYRIKQAAKLAGLNDITTQSKVVRGRRVPVEDEKHNFITTHTARRTLVTTMRAKGFTYDEIAVLTGHKGKRGIIEQYDKAGKIEKAVRIARELLK